MKKAVVLLVSIISLCSCKNQDIKDRLGKSSLVYKNGWFNIHLEGSPVDIGFQNGYLLSNQIDTAIKATGFFLEHETKHDWNFYRACAKNFLWDKLDREYKDEINGIVEGLAAKGIKYDSLDITAYNATQELAYYYVPQLMNKEKPNSGNNKAPGNCSAFIATGSFTKDGKIVMGHNNWTNYLLGQYWNVVADIVPEKGNHIVMDCMPGFIHSGDDFIISSNGILMTETTITQFLGFDTSGIPEFQRARKVAQYANNIDDAIKIFTAGNNGGYANDWLIGDTKTNEVAKLELGLKNYRVWRSKDTAMIGSNFASDPKLIKEETTFNVNDISNSANARKLRMEKLVLDLRGKLDEETAKTLEADHFDAVQNKLLNNRCVVCGHIDEDALGCKEFDMAPYYPSGAVQGKVTTADMAKDMKLWAHLGHPCGKDFTGETFFAAHPEYKWQEKYLKNMKSYPWAIFQAKK